MLHRAGPRRAGHRDASELRPTPPGYPQSLFGHHFAIVTSAAWSDSSAPIGGVQRPRFDITATRPAQLTFGAGVHFCLRDRLARAEMRVAMPILATRLRDLALDGPVTSRRPIGLTGSIALPLGFTTARRI